MNLGPEEAATHLAVGTAAQEPGRGKAAEQAYPDALRMDPQDTLARNNLAVLWMNRRFGGPLDAVGDLAAALAAGPRTAPACHNLEVVAFQVLFRARWIVLVCLFVAMPTAGGSGIGQGDAPQVGAPGPRIAALAVIAAVWGLWW